ncbi:MAG: GNAT family N-acetyltransferase [Proteobacteria bacterium]|nr:GNAT family N-acetyltransferase [Pseudomonadota bacterium]
MAESPIIKTPRLRIIPFSKEYLTPRYTGWLNDPEVMRYSEQRHKSHTLESCRQYWQSFADTPHYFWAVTAIDPNIGHIGNINAYVDEKNSLADIGIMIGEKTAWRKGYGLEAWQAVCSYLLDDVGIRKVTAGTMAANKSMLRIMEKSGMVADGRRIRHYIFNAAEVDVIHAALFKTSFKKV